MKRRWARAPDPLLQQLTPGEARASITTSSSHLTQEPRLQALSRVWAPLSGLRSPSLTPRVPPLKATEGPQQGQAGEHRACGHGAEWAAHATRTASPLAQGLSSPTASRHIISIPKLQKVLVPECGVRGLLSEGPECGQSPIAILPWWGQGGWTGTCPLSVHRGGLSQAPAACAPRTFLGSHGAGQAGCQKADLLQAVWRPYCRGLRGRLGLVQMDRGTSGGAGRLRGPLGGAGGRLGEGGLLRGSGTLCWAGSRGRG